MIKLHWQNWPKTKHFPYLWRPAAEGDQGFLRHLSRLKTEPDPQPRCLSRPIRKKTSFDVSTSRHIISELWLWHFMAACTSANTFVVYKHFFQKTQLGTWTWTTPLSRIQNSITGLFSICFVKIVLHKPSHDMRLNLSQRTCGYSNRCQMGSRIVWMYDCAGYGGRVWGCMAGYPGPICRHGVRWSHWGIGLPA